MIFKKILILIAFANFIFSDESWKLYDGSEYFTIDLVSLTGWKILSKTVLSSSSANIIVPININKKYGLGTYFIRIMKNNNAISKKIILLK
mgnify:CR=1 FL=1